jgi:hypothetical protein
MEIARKTNPWERKNESLFFGLHDKSVRVRKIWRFLLFTVIWTFLGGTTWFFTLSQIQEPEQRFAIALAGFIKYLPLLFISYFVARKQAVRYLDDIFELKDEKIAAAFIKEVAFGGKEQQITIDKGKISEEDGKSPIVLIGGPGNILVKLDSVAVLEKLDGEPEIISPRTEPWEIGCFERIREVGKYEESAKSRYAIINIRDQFVRDIKIVARTKDGVRIYVERIKVKFSILRNLNSQKPSDLEKNPFTFDRKAVHNLVYNQSVITQPYDKPTGITFPWDSTVIPLVKLELERLIQSHLLSETFSGMSQKEFDDLVEREKENKRANYHLLGDKPFEKEQEPAAITPSLIPRSVIKDFFYSPAFKQKAADLGVEIHWIDIGTWQFDEKVVSEKVREARDLSMENRKRKVEIQRQNKLRTNEEFIQLIRKVVVSNFDQAVSIKNFKTEWQELAATIKKNPELSSPYVVRQILQQMAIKRDSQTRALDMLRAFRMEFLAARGYIQAEERSPIEKETELRKINNALANIEKLIYHYLPPP